MIEKSKENIDFDAEFPITVHKRLTDDCMIYIYSHWHDFIEIIFVGSGTADVKVNNEIKTLHENEFAFINSTQVHLVTASQKGTELFFINIPFEFLHGCSDDRIISEYIYPLYLKKLFIEPFISEECLAGYIRNILNEYEIGARGYEMSIKAYILLLFSSLVRGHTDTTGRYKSGSVRMYDEIVKSVNYIDSHYAEPNLINKIHTVAGLEQSYFSKKFKSTMGISPVGYITNVRLNKANELIYFSEMSVSDISDTVGFDTPNYFIKKYRDVFGKTPLSVRKNK